MRDDSSGSTPDSLEIESTPILKRECNRLTFEKIRQIEDLILDIQEIILLQYT